MPFACVKVRAYAFSFELPKQWHTAVNRDSQPGMAQVLAGPYAQFLHNVFGLNITDFAHTVGTSLKLKEALKNISSTQSREFEWPSPTREAFALGRHVEAARVGDAQPSGNCRRAGTLESPAP